MQIKTTKRYHLTGQNGHYHQVYKQLSAVEGMDKSEPSCTVSGNAN